MWELYTETKLPIGWSTGIPGHAESNGKSGNGKRSYTYNSWYSMIRRCYLNHYDNPNSSSSIYYQSLGIKVCRRWIEGDGTQCGFLCFLEDMGERPEGTTIGRNPWENYTPDTCEWHTPQQQGKDRRKNRKKAA